MVFYRERIVNKLRVLEGDEAEAPGPPRDRVLHDHRVLHRAELGEILPKLVYTAQSYTVGICPK